MLRLFIFLIIIIFKADACYPKMARKNWPVKYIEGTDIDPVEITLNIQMEKEEVLICDHNDIHTKRYTVLEGEEFKIIAKYNYDINHLMCQNDYNGGDLYQYTDKVVLKNVTTATFKAEKRMGNLWKCTMLVHQDNATILPVVHFKEHKYTEAYCYIQIHVRQRNSPQTFLVNNMALQAVPTDLSEKDVDLIAEYQYADGDIVNVTCTNLLNPVPLKLAYNMMAGTMSKDPTMKESDVHDVIGFVTKLHSRHNRSYMLCTNIEPTDYTTVMLGFIMRAQFNIISVRINGMTLRPTLKNVTNNYYEIEYKYQSQQLINVVCEVQRTDMKLAVVDIFDFAGKVSSYNRTELIPKKKAEMSFYLNSADDKKLLCESYHISGANAEQIIIHFTAGHFPIDQYPLHMELPSNGTVATQLYNDYKLKVIYYEFNDGETLRLKCGSLRFVRPGPVLYLQFSDSGICKTNGCALTKILKLTRKYDNTAIICYLKEVYSDKANVVLREIRLMLQERNLTTTSTTNTTSPVISLTTNAPADSASSGTPPYNYTLVYCLTAAGVSVIIVLLLIYWSVKKPNCCKRSSPQLPPEQTPRPHPVTNYYENMLAVFQPINEREAMELEHHYEEVQ